MRRRAAVAISTTGHPHRMRFLETCVRNWSAALREDDGLFVTVDGSVEDTLRVAKAVEEHTRSVYRVGQPQNMSRATDQWLTTGDTERMGVAVNKNTGLELMMDNAEAEHLFLSDDDTWPLYAAALDKHINLEGEAHSMVCWGRKRLKYSGGPIAAWTWPRGVMLYVHRSVVDLVGGMDERFGAGGHEHAEWSQRIHNAMGIHDDPFISPASYATRNAMGAAALWHCEDMPRPTETGVSFASRKQALTTIQRGERDWARIHAVMAEREGSSDFVGFRATDNGRAWATLSSDLPSLGAEGRTT